MTDLKQQTIEPLLPQTRDNDIENTNTTDSNSSNKLDLDKSNVRILNQLIADTKTPWQVFNCKITEKTASQDLPLPFLYHYDSLADDIKKTHPLTPALLKQFKTPMLASDAAKLIGVKAVAIANPWQVKVTGTLVLFCEPLQTALRLKFTNTAKAAQEVYVSTSEDALATAMTDWHFYGEVFVLNKSPKALTVFNIDETDYLQLNQSSDYKYLPSAYALGILSVLETHKDELLMIDEAIQLRLA